MPVDIRALVGDLAAESAVIDGLLTGLRPEDWACPTPSIGWNITDQVSHLAYFDQTTVTSLRDADRFRAEAAVLVADGDDFADRVAAEFRSTSPGEMLSWFRTARAELLESYLAVDPRARLPWYGPDMGVASSVTARLMETWAHGQDIADALGVTREPTARLRHVAHLGVAGLPYSYGVNGMELPTDPIRVEVTAPDGGVWSWGPGDALDRVSGPALDFCLAVTQRRHLDDLGLTVSGPTARRWMGIAQTFAGPAGTGRAPREDTSIGADR
jgi:uncharacterized protein (TIGR03084 family)